MVKYYLKKMFISYNIGNVLANLIKKLFFEKSKLLSHIVKFVVVA